MARTSAASTLPSPKAMAWSVRLMASRMEPSAARPSSQSASASKGTFSAPSTWVRCSTTRSGGMFFRENCRQRERMVTGSFCGSVVASRNFTCGGGSSRVLSSALNECVESMCTSSIR
ncbi:hypothetical protein D9M70_502720 [compost metagenome]